MAGTFARFAVRYVAHVFARKLLVVAGLALSLGACGGGDETASSTPVYGTKQADWAKAAGARCLEYQKAALKVQQKYAAEKYEPQEAIEGAMRDGIPLMKGMISDLRAIDVPEDVREDWTAFVDAYDDVISYLPQYIDEQIAGTESADMREKITAVGRKVEAISGTYDVGACAQVTVQ